MNPVVTAAFQPRTMEPIGMGTVKSTHPEAQKPSVKSVKANAWANART